MFLTSPLDQMELCRICLITERVDISIFEVEGDDEYSSQLSTKINICLPIKISKDDKLPKKICTDCFYKLESFYQFYNISAKAEQQLLSWLVEGENLIQEEAKKELPTKTLEEVIVKQDPVEEVIVKPDPAEESDYGEGFCEPTYSDSEDDIEKKPTTSKPSKKVEDTRTEKQKMKAKKKYFDKKYKLGGRLFFKYLGTRHWGCTECDEEFDKKRLVRDHFKKTHVEPKEFPCRHCNKIFTKSKDLVEHRTEHGIDKNEPLFFCDQCGFKSTNKYGFNAHVVRRHGTEYKYSCDHCDQKFKLKNDLIPHMEVHENLTFMCDICGKFCPSRIALRQHRRLKHVNTPNFICSICKSRCISQKNLDKHIRDNHPDNDHQCETCGKQFKLKKHLYEHRRRLHENAEKPHLCNVCGKSFITANNYRIHFLSHTKIKPYKCNICRNEFSQRSSLMLHWKKKHPDEGEPPPRVILTDVFETLQLDKGVVTTPSSTVSNQDL